LGEQFAHLRQSGLAPKQWRPRTRWGS
jgi:hypothetical protein